MSNKTRRKRDFPTKVCPVCGRSFAWRKKWARDWEEVVYCSARCRREKKILRPGDSSPGSTS